MKKIFLIMCLMFVAIGTASARSINISSVDSINVNDTFDVTYKISDDVDSAQFNLSYDKDYLELISEDSNITLDKENNTYKAVFKAIKVGNTKVSINTDSEIDFDQKDITINEVDNNSSNQINNNFNNGIVNANQLRSEPEIINPSISYQAHVQNIGWQGYVGNNVIAGTTGRSLRIEALRINLEKGSYDGDIAYQVHLAGKGWVNYVGNNVIAGTTGQSRQVEAIKIKLTGDIANYYDIYYRTHIQNKGWTGWTSNDNISGSVGFGYRMEAIQIMLVKKGDPAPDTSGNSYYERPASVTYQTHVQNIGWQRYVGNNAIAGTTGRGLRIEALRINLDSGVNYSGSITYQVHLAVRGWVNYVGNNAIAGTTGQSRQVEAIKVKLTGSIANYYDIYYRTHIQNIGWTGWSKNGSVSGSSGYGYRMEAIQIMLVRKGDSAPDTRGIAYYEGPANISYQAHVQNIGWQKYVDNDAIAGTTGQSRAIEALRIRFNPGGLYPNSSISYQMHVAGKGWLSYVGNNAIAGTTGQSRRAEAIKIKLTGEIANYYDIYYRTHIQSIGWTGWTSNDNVSGSSGFGYRMEAIQIMLVKKGDLAPDTSGTPYYVKPEFIWYYNNGRKTLANTNTGVLGTNVKKYIDVSEFQGTINWDKVKAEADIDGVILRIGFGSGASQLDRKFLYNLAAVKRLNIPYTVYLYSYAENETEARWEAENLARWLGKYDVVVTNGLPIYLDIEEYDNVAGGIEKYNKVLPTFVKRMNELGYGAKGYANLSTTQRLSNEAKGYVDWIAQYYVRCTYTGNYTMWQYTSSGSIPGITGSVDINMRK